MTKKQSRKKLFLSVCWVVPFLISSCSTNPNKRDTEFTSSRSEAEAKNLILLIGDGMGPQQISLLYYYLQHKNLGLKENQIKEPFAFEKIANSGRVAISTTDTHDDIVTDSACSATQLAVGKSSRSQMIGLDHNGDPVKTILEKARDKGLATGLVSDTRMTHATPASFASHVADRWLSTEIAEKMIQSGTNVMFSGGMRDFVPKDFKKSPEGEAIRAKYFNPGSKRKDERNLVKEAEKKGYRVIYNRKELRELSPSHSNQNSKVLGFFKSGSMPSSIWQNKNRKNPERTVPNLLEMTKKAVEILERNEKGFFLMVEAGQIDWTAHQNDVGGMLQEMRTINFVANWLKKYVDENPETVLVVTADHETGGFGFAYNVHQIPGSQKLSGEAFKKRDYQPLFNFVEKSVVEKIARQKKTLRELWMEFDALPKEQKTATKLKVMIDYNTGFKISLDKARRVLETEPNRFYQADHRILNKKNFAVMHDDKEFYYNLGDTRSALIGRTLAADHGVSWSAGGHTATPVYLFAYGSQKATRQFKNSTNHVEVGRTLQEILGVR